MLMKKLEEYTILMESQYKEIRPLFDSLGDKMVVGMFNDVIMSEPVIWPIYEKFKENNKQFYEIIKQAVDSEMVFDKIECKKKLVEYVNT